MSDDLTASEPPVPKRSRWTLLRVAVSVFFGLLGLLFPALTVRSQYTVDVLGVPLSKQRLLAFTSSARELELSLATLPNANLTGIQLYSMDLVVPAKIDAKFGYVHLPNERRLIVPLRFLNICAWLLAASPWLLPRQLPRGFSLRTLLIVTTFVAVMLAWMLWIVR